MEKQNLPNAIAVLVLGILSILTCCCYGYVGLILAIIALFLAKKDLKLYHENPSGYLNYSTMNAGRILAIIGVVLNIIVIVISLFFAFAFSQEEKDAFMEQYMEMLEEMKQNQQ